MDSKIDIMSQNLAFCRNRKNLGSALPLNIPLAYVGYFVTIIRYLHPYILPDFGTQSYLV